MRAGRVADAFDPTSSADETDDPSPTPEAETTEPEPLEPQEPQPLEPEPLEPESSPNGPDQPPAESTDEASDEPGAVLIDGQCRPLCVDGSATDPDDDGWGWENEESCVVEGSALATGAPSCNQPAEAANPSAPVPVDPIEVTGDAERPAGGEGSGFFVDGGRPYDANGNDFVIRGVNNAHVWFDTDGRYEADDALPPIANYGFNTVRIVWEAGRAEPSLLREIVARVVELEMIPMLELHDATGSMSNDDLHAMARYYAQDDVRPILVDFERYLLVNIANEWSGQDFRAAYEGAIDILRNAGINHTLVIDGNQWGQNSDSILDNGVALLEYDPQHNLLFSNHMYETYGNQNGGAERITTVLEEAVARQLPYIVGEFGHQHGDPLQSIDFQHILDECARLELGYIAWSWKGNNSDVAYLDMAVDWGGNQLTDWGDSIINGPNGVSETSMKSSVFLL